MIAYYKKNQSRIITVSLVLGAIFGLLFPNVSSSIGFIGEIFLRLIQMGLPLLILGQVVGAVSNLNLTKLGKLGGQTVGLFVLQAALGTLWGILTAVLFNTGRSINFVSAGQDVINGESQNVVDVIVGIFPTNIIESLTAGSMIQIVVFAILFGMGLSLVKYRGEGKNLADFITDFNTTIIELINIVMLFAPIGVFTLVANALSKYGSTAFLPIINFILVLTFGCLSYLLIWYIITGIYLKVSPMLLINKTLNLGLFSFAVSSSAIALPEQIKVSTKDLGISQEAASFIMPLGMSLNSPASAMSNAMILVVAGQLHGVNYNLSDYIIIFFIGLLASYATAVIPGGGIVSLNMILPQMGFGAETLALFAAPDYLNGMTRTIPNVNLDVLAGLIVAKNLNELDYDILKSSNQGQFRPGKTNSLN